MSISKSFFISFEGIDACGKSTQVKLLLNQMNKASKNTILVREPGGSTISERIREILLDKNLQEMSERTEALLMTASRSQLTYEKIIKNLKHGKNVISDRFSDSTLAYQGGGRELDIDWLIKLNKFATFDIKPDITFLIDLHPEEALKRKNIQQDRIENAGIEFQLKVRNMYLHVSKLFQDRIVIIDGHEKASVINKKILDELFRRNIINEDII
jgi:dTMP kinase